MPIYEYECRSCGFRFERMQKVTDAPPKNCPKCGKNHLKKLLFPPAIQFKGSGWYVTDYGKKGSPESDKPSQEDKKTPTADDGAADSGKKD